MKVNSRYAAKLLFQFRVVTKSGDVGKVRTVESRIVLIKAISAKLALSEAKRIGVESAHKFKNDVGGTVHFEFVGVLDLMHLGHECADNEVWYEIGTMLQPSERKSKLIPAESALSAIRNEKEMSVAR